VSGYSTPNPQDIILRESVPERLRQRTTLATVMRAMLDKAII